MAKFNKSVRTGVTSPVKSTKQALNADFKLGYEREKQSELFLLAVSNFVGKDTFYESAKNRDDRFATLCADVAVQDCSWFLGFVSWLRNDAFMRSAAVVAAVEGAKALHGAEPFVGAENASWPRRIIAAAQARADEPGEVLAYYEAKYGKNFPAFLKKGVADGAKRLYNEYSLLKYDTDSKGYRFADVLQLTHAKAIDPKQNTLFAHALDRRYDSSKLPDPVLLHMVGMRRTLEVVNVDLRRSYLRAMQNNGIDVLKQAGMTWEALSGWLQGPMDKFAWESVIPSMGHMALLRNLRNFQEAGVSALVMKDVLAKISDPEKVAKSKQFPFRYLAAYQANKGSLPVSAALESALETSLINVPSLTGRTLILVDRSGSMFTSHGGVQGLDRADTAAIFGSALALRAENADLVQFGSAWRGPAFEKVSFRKGDSILPMLDKFRDMGGTDTEIAVRGSFKNHDRVIIITDEQYNGYGGDPLQTIPANVPVYTWNLGGYKVGQSKSGSKKRHTFGGLTDKGFQMIPLIEAGQSQTWPWLVK